MQAAARSTFGEAESLRCRGDFPSLRRRFGGQPVAFLDGPGGTQVPNAVIEAIADCYRNRNVNTHGNFPPSMELDERHLAARSAIADFLGAAGPQSISIGQNMTSLAFALARALGRTIRPGDEVLITQLDHEANRSPWRLLQEHGAIVREVPLLATGALDYGVMKSLITHKTRILALGCSSNAIGTVNDVATARALTRAVGAALILDAVHYAPHFPIDVQKLDPDFLLCSAYKFYGPHVGILYSRAGALEGLNPDRISVQDGAAPYRIETGTLNHAAVEGVAAAIDYLAGFGRGGSRRAAVHDAVAAISDYEHSLGRLLWLALEDIPTVRLWGLPFTQAERAPTVSFTLAGQDPAAVARRLGAQGICIWDGNHYAPRPLEILKVPDGSTLRVGFSMYNSAEEVLRLMAVIRELS
ncbi:MAG TPA: cysteine desulfurase-like protein [Steroidobacteraceae bacterium]|jgi:cysteine desulfurase family protein (TIGR01976 family)|nr:cysteine desulfurase-like protein [Steroidobacteraceae bacterium]